MRYHGRASAFALLFSVVTIVPATTFAEHKYDQPPLLRAARSLHASSQRFEGIACRRPLPRHEIEHIRLMTEKVCRLVEGLERLEGWGRVRGDYHVVRDFARVVDRRLRKACPHGSDRMLMHSWHDVQEDLYAVGCLVEGHEIGYRPSFPRYGRDFSTHRDWQPRGGPYGGEPIYGHLDGRRAPTQRGGPGYRHGFADSPPRWRGELHSGPHHDLADQAVPHGIRSGQHPRGRQGGPRITVDPRRMENAPPWLRLLIAALDD